MEVFVNKINQELNQLVTALYNLPISGGKKILMDYSEEIEDEVTFQLQEFTKHRNKNTFWLSLAPIQHWFGECQDQVENSTATPEVIEQLTKDLDSWLERIEKSIPNFQPEHMQIVTILELANDGKFYDESTHDWYTVMPEDWPYKHLFEG